MGAKQKMKMSESLVKNTIPNTYVKNGIVFQTQKPNRKVVFLGSIHEVVEKIIGGQLD